MAMASDGKTDAMEPKAFFLSGGTSVSTFQSFWMGGFEGADHVNEQGVPLDINRRNGHGMRLQGDYDALVTLGIRTVRESIGWRLTEAGGAAALDALESQAHTASQSGVQVIWTLMHYGWPIGLDPLSRPDEFVDAFGDYCARIASLIVRAARPAPVWQPVNEISFLAWAASSSGLIHPYRRSAPENGHRLKRELVRAALRAMDRIRSIRSSARFVHTGALVNIAPPLGPDRRPAVRSGV